MNILSPMATGNGAYVIHKILSEKIPNYHICGYNPNWTLFPPALPLLCRKKISPDLIHTTPDYAWFFNKRRTPMIITFHGYTLDSYMENHISTAQFIHYKTDLRFFTKKALARANIITSVSQFTAKLAQKDMDHEGEIKVIYNGIDSHLFHPKKKSPQKKIKVLFSGNLTKTKGADLLPLIARKLNKNIEIIYTSGLRTNNRLSSAPNLHNIGVIPFPDMPCIYQQADILLFPTVREGFGLAAAEAMSCGLPVVATDCSSLPELIIHGKGGYLCELRNADDFAGRINELAASPELRQQMGGFNRARVEKKFTVEQMVRNYVELFSGILDTR